MTHAFGGGPSTVHSTVSSFRTTRFIIDSSMTFKLVLGALVSRPPSGWITDPDELDAAATSFPDLRNRAILSTINRMFRF